MQTTIYSRYYKHSNPSGAIIEIIEGDNKNYTLKVSNGFMLDCLFTKGGLILHNGLMLAYVADKKGYILFDGHVGGLDNCTFAYNIFIKNDEINAGDCQQKELTKYNLKNVINKILGYNHYNDAPLKPETEQPQFKEPNIWFNDARIGNWFKSNSQPDGFQLDINSLQRMLNGAEEYEPIPMNDDTIINLLRLKKDHEKNGTIFYKIKDNLFIENERLFICGKDFILYSRCKYIHQFQNWYYFTFGEEWKYEE